MLGTGQRRPRQVHLVESRNYFLLTNVIFFNHLSTRTDLKIILLGDEEDASYTEEAAIQGIDLILILESCHGRLW